VIREIEKDINKINDKNEEYTNPGISDVNPRIMNMRITNDEYVNEMPVRNCEKIICIDLTYLIILLRI
jgi:hypothetical protein